MVQILTLFQLACLSILLGILLRVIDPGILLDHVHLILPHGCPLCVSSESAGGVNVDSCRAHEVVPIVLLL